MVFIVFVVANRDITIECFDTVELHNIGRQNACSSVTYTQFYRYIEHFSVKFACNTICCKQKCARCLYMGVFVCVLPYCLRRTFTGWPFEIKSWMPFLWSQIATTAAATATNDNDGLSNSDFSNDIYGYLILFWIRISHKHLYVCICAAASARILKNSTLTLRLSVCSGIVDPNDYNFRTKTILPFKNERTKKRAQRKRKNLIR